MLKLFQARLQHYVNQELPDVQLGLEKAEKPELKLPTSLRLLKEQGEKKKKKECSNYRTSALISHTSKVMLRILQDRLQQYVNRELLMFKLVFARAPLRM